MNRYQLAYAEGYDAYLAGVALISNPYRVWSEQSSGWNNGWNDAAKLNPPTNQGDAKREILETGLTNPPTRASMLPMMSRRFRPSSLWLVTDLSLRSELDMKDQCVSANRKCNIKAMP
jgi:ribosome modulation factor